MINGVIFDLGNTLMWLDADGKQVEESGTAAMVEFLQENGIKVGSDFLADFRAARQDGWRLAEETHIEHTVEEALATALAQQSVTARDGLLTRAVERFFSKGEVLWRLYPGVIETLQALKASGMRIGLVSNADDDGLIQRGAVRLGLAPYMHPILSSAGGEKWRKPDPRIFKLVADEWKLAPGEISMVGDAPRYDILGAHLAGMKGVLIDRKEGYWWQGIPSELADNPAVRPDATIGHLRELVPLFKTL